MGVSERNIIYMQHTKDLLKCCAMFVSGTKKLCNSEKKLGKVNKY